MSLYNGESVPTEKSIWETVEDKVTFNAFPMMIITNWIIIKAETWSP